MSTKCAACITALSQPRVFQVAGCQLRLVLGLSPGMGVQRVKFKLLLAAFAALPLQAGSLLFQANSLPITDAAQKMNLCLGIIVPTQSRILQPRSVCL